jgi:predicted nucleotidyltransferase
LKRGPWPEEVAGRLLRALHALAQRLRDTPGVVGVVLFGSYARGDFGRKSDVDLLVLADLAGGRTLGDVRAAAVRAAIEAETAQRLPMHLAVLVADVAAPQDLGPDLVHALWTDGVVLFADAAALAVLRPTDLSPWVVLRFSAAGLAPSVGVRVSRRLHGRAGRPGLVRPPAVELGRGAFLLPASRSTAIRDALDEIGVDYDLIPVWRPV